MFEAELNAQDYARLGEFRYRIRRFLHFSEDAAREEQLEPQQHQMLLAIRAVSDPEGPTIGSLAEHLLIRHHSAVGLIDRLEERGLVTRVKGITDRRQVRVHLTETGDTKLKRLAAIHRAELRTSGPVLVRTLQALLDGLSLPPAGQKGEDVSTT